MKALNLAGEVNFRKKTWTSSWNLDLTILLRTRRFHTQINMIDNRFFTLRVEPKGRKVVTEVYNF